MHINVLVRATSTSIENITESPWAGVDHGVYLLLKDGIIPKYTYGDFDSITEKERRFIDETLEINPVESEKDDTDLALAIAEAIDAGYDDIEIYGAKERNSMFVQQLSKYYHSIINLYIIGVILNEIL